MTALENCLFHGLPALRLRTKAGASATVTLHGAHVVSWVSANGVEQLYLSPTARFDSGLAIRGGIPVIFPQFNTRGVLPRHGFARTSPWGLLPSAASDDESSVTLSLRISPAIQSIWPHAFDCQLKISLRDESLMVGLTVSNSGSQTFDFQAALHTYLAIGSIESACIKGLDNCDYEDCTEATSNVMKRHSALKPFEAIDRIYYDAPTAMELQSSNGFMELRQTGFFDVVVWNPGAAANTSPDLPPDGYKHFLCVEAALIGRPMLLAPTEVWGGTQILRAAR